MNKAERRPFIGGNWKCFGTPGDVQRYLTSLSAALGGASSADIVLAFPEFLLPEAVSFASSSFQFFSQDVSRFPTGAYTGETAAAQLSALGVSGSLVGHSERRTLLGETDADVSEKLLQTQDRGMQALLCVGESADIRAAGGQYAHVSAQLNAALSAYPADALSLLTVAYEPIWAIGTGNSATPADAEEMIMRIRVLLKSLFGNAADCIRILYGGSVTAANAFDYLSCPSIDGVLVGSASRNAEEFAAIARAAEG